MSLQLPRLFLVRHGDTDWTDTHQRTGRTDLPLNARGEVRARQLGHHLRAFTFVRVFSSPLQRASRTCELAGFAARRELESDLVEWDYGEFEGLRTREILERRPGWELFRDGCPAGESPSDVAARADRFLARTQPLAGDVLAFSSGHISRMIAARWLGLPPSAARFFYCDPASVGILGFEHDRRDEPIISLWNFALPAADSSLG
jgi:probable phosphoglycerate mutase